MLVVGNHGFLTPSCHTQGRICHSSTDYVRYQDRTSANRLGVPTPLRRGPVAETMALPCHIIPTAARPRLTWMTRAALLPTPEVS
ncbi:unnamed protein product [Caenorhabditis auriculariae]|uniref:Uncharacterized protein n=1 Tax=Caenorhabditis auriculariae TaxID=2777116 RepID=A0A8S1HPT9_9PELO|nr:unnamed protein product [Caenorhabditis auriculariae]